MNFKPDPKKQGWKIIFTRKKTALLLLYFYNGPVKSTQIYKHLGIMLDSNVS